MHGKTKGFANEKACPRHWTYMSLSGPGTSVTGATRGVVTRRHSGRTKKNGEKRARPKRWLVYNYERFEHGMVISVFMAVGVKGNCGLIPVHGV